MSELIKFTIDHKEFYCDLALLTAPSFIIQSVPRPYSVTLANEANPMERINQLFANHPKNILLIDQKVLELYRSQLNIPLTAIFSMQATEEMKTLTGVTHLIDFLQKNKFTKGEQLIVVGGGIIQDIGAFAGAMYKRGIPWIYFPTTLLSMCDSCIGGKTAVNYQGAKNQLALFSAPSAVVIHPTFLKTLNHDAIKSGLGEILKLCITGGEKFVALYQNHVKNGCVANAKSLHLLIMAALCVKKAVVEADEFELNHRRSLNYGHTLGHAIEILSNYAIPHGQAVVVGMALVNELSHQQGLLNTEELTLLNQLCYDLLDETVMEHLAAIDLNQIISLVQKDKKTEGQMTSFVLMKTAGDTHFIKLSLDDSLKANIDCALKRIIRRA